MSGYCCEKNCLVDVESGSFTFKYLTNVIISATKTIYWNYKNTPKTNTSKPEISKETVFIIMSLYTTYVNSANCIVSDQKKIKHYFQLLRRRRRQVWRHKEVRIFLTLWMNTVRKIPNLLHNWIKGRWDVNRQNWI